MEDPPPEEPLEGGEEPTPEAEEPAPEPAPEIEDVAEPPPEAQPEEQEEVQVADHMPTESTDIPNQGDGNVRRESTVSNIPLTQATVLDQLKAADEEARNTMLLMASMRKAIEEYQNKPHMTEEDTRMLEEKQMELLQKLSEFEAITRKMQLLVGLSGSSLTQFKPSEFEKEGAAGGEAGAKGEAEKGGAAGMGIETEKGIQTREDDFYATPEDMLPQLVVCGFANQVPRILICETGDKPKPKPKPTMKPKCQKYARQMKPQPQKGQCSCVQEQLRAKDNTINCLKKKMCALETEMQRTVNQNSNLYCELAKAKQQQCPASEERAVCPVSCVPQCVANYSSQRKVENDRCPPQCAANRPKEPETELCPSRCPPQCSANSPIDSAKAQKYSMNAVCLKSQLNIIELEVQKMREELSKAQKEQQQMEDRRDLLKCAAPKCLTANSSDISPCACTAPPPPPPPSPYAGCVCVQQQR